MEIASTTQQGVKLTDAKEWELRLYIAGKTPRAIQAFSNLRKICETYLEEGVYHIEVIDLLEKPQLAQGDQIVAVPTLVRPAARTGSQDHWRPFEYRTCLGRFGHS